MRTSTVKRLAASVAALTCVESCGGVLVSADPALSPGGAGVCARVMMDARAKEDAPYFTNWRREIVRGVAIGCGRNTVKAISRSRQDICVANCHVTVRVRIAPTRALPRRCGTRQKSV